MPSTFSSVFHQHTRFASQPRCPPSLEDVEIDDLVGEHSSFYLAEPAKISTPPRKRRTTVTLYNFRPPVIERRASDSGSIPMDLTDPVGDTIREIDSNRAASRPSHRRRTVVHLSSDSIFSSALDFSAYMTEFSPTQRLKPVNQADGLLDVLSDLPVSTAAITAPSANVLDPAFSPALVSASHAGSEELVIVPVSPATLPIEACSVPPTPGDHHVYLSQRSLSLQTPPGTDDFPDMFNSLGLGAGVYFTSIYAPFLTSVRLPQKLTTLGSV